MIEIMDIRPCPANDSGTVDKNSPMPIRDRPFNAGFAFAFALAGIHVVEVAPVPSFKVPSVGSCPSPWLQDDRPRATAR